MKKIHHTGPLSRDLRRATCRKGRFPLRRECLGAGRAGQEKIRQPAAEIKNLNSFRFRRKGKFNMRSARQVRASSRERRPRWCRKTRLYDSDKDRDPARCASKEEANDYPLLSRIRIFCRWEIDEGFHRHRGARPFAGIAG